MLEIGGENRGVVPGDDVGVAVRGLMSSAPIILASPRPDQQPAISVTVLL
jgi:hypothetical protein